MGGYFCGLVYLVFYVFLPSVWLCLSLFWGSFFYDLVEDPVHDIDLGFFPLNYVHSVKIWSFHGIPNSLHVPFLCPFKNFSYSLLV